MNRATNVKTILQRVGRLEGLKIRDGPNVAQICPITQWSGEGTHETRVPSSSTRSLGGSRKLYPWVILKLNVGEHLKPKVWVKLSAYSSRQTSRFHHDPKH